MGGTAPSRRPRKDAQVFCFSGVLHLSFVDVNMRLFGVCSCVDFARTKGAIEETCRGAEKGIEQSPSLLRRRRIGQSRQWLKGWRSFIEVQKETNSGARLGKTHCGTVCARSGIGFGSTFGCASLKRHSVCECGGPQCHRKELTCANRNRTSTRFQRQRVLRRIGCGPFRDASTDQECIPQTFPGPPSRQRRRPADVRDDPPSQGSSLRRASSCSV